MTRASTTRRSLLFILTTPGSNYELKYWSSRSQMMLALAIIITTMKTLTFYQLTLQASLSTSRYFKVITIC
jgi:hypothetical protein